MQDLRRYSPSAARNRAPLLSALRGILPSASSEPRLLVEVGSGSGEHAAHIAPALTGWVWQPTEYSADALGGIDQHARDADPGAQSIRPALQMDAAAPEWPFAEECHAVFSANVIHISPFEVCAGIIGGAARHLEPGGVLVFYGPFRKKGAHTAPSNAAFDQDLRARDPNWGIRDLERIADLAQSHGFKGPTETEMPANNLLIRFQM